MSRLTSTLIAGLAFAAATTAAAHDFWIQPASFTVETGATQDVAFMVGHPEDLSPWPLTPHRVIALRSVGPDGITDRQSALSDWQPGAPLSMSFDTPGYHLVTIETTSAFSRLNADKFNDYVEDEGITPIKLDRVARGLMETPGTEIYSRRGKALIAVGDISGTETGHVFKPVGMTLEIVPTVIPADLEEDGDLTAQVYYRGEIAAGVSVVLVSLGDMRGDLSRETSDANGTVTFALPETGAYMLHAVWSDPLETADADFDTIFSSFSFAVD